MKLNSQETELTFFVELTAETVPEAALLLRMAKMSKRRTVVLNTAAHRSGDISTWISFRKDKRADATIKK